MNIPKKNGVRKSTKNQIETWKFEKRKKKQIAKEEKKNILWESSSAKFSWGKLELRLNKVS